MTRSKVGKKQIKPMLRRNIGIHRYSGMDVYRRGGERDGRPVYECIGVIALRTDESAGEQHCEARNEFARVMGKFPTQAEALRAYGRDAHLASELTGEVSEDQDDNGDL
jgi:hypothetical protein